MDEDRALYLAMIVTGSPPIVIAVATGAQIGVGPTMGGMVLGLGLLGLVRTYFQARAEAALVPRARWVKRHR